MVRAVFGLFSLLLPLFGLPAEVAEEYYYEVPYRGEEELYADLKLVLGKVYLQKAEPDYLFQAEVRLKEDGLRPEFSYERKADAGHVRLALDTKKEHRGIRFDRQLTGDNRWRVYLTDRVPVTLNMELAVVDAEMDLTDIPVRALDMECGVARTRMRFQRPNPVVMHALRIEAGASEFVGEGLGYSRARLLRFEGGMGRFELDLTGGAFPEGAQVEVSVGMGALKIHLPEEEPVVLELPSRWLLKTEIPTGYTKKGADLWYNEWVRNPDEALHVTIDASMGVVQLLTR